MQRSPQHRSVVERSSWWLLSVVYRIMPSSVLQLFEGFWTVPLVLTFLGVAGGVAILLIDGAAVIWLTGEWITHLSPSGARDALSAVAGGVLTVASIVFSLTFVALSITAQQLSPRILDDVLQDRSTQVLLGLSLATFLFSSIALLTGGASEDPRLALAAPIAVLLATLTMIMVVVFAHSMSRVMRADDMVARFGARLIASIRAAGGPPVQCAVAAPERAAEFDAAARDGTDLRATAVGYVGAVGYAQLVNWASQEGLLIDLDICENDFVLEGQPVVRIAGLHDDGQSAAKRVTRHLNLSDRRMPGVSPRYRAAALREAALRALSPGINDPSTAMSCADHLFQGIQILATSPEPPNLLSDGQGIARLRIKQPGLAQFVHENIRPIVEAADDEASLTYLDRIAEVVTDLAKRSDDVAVLDRLRGEIAEKLRDRGV
jgi:uncharacterized membrane protein